MTTRVSEGVIPLNDRARACTPLTKSEEKERLLAVYSNSGERKIQILLNPKKILLLCKSFATEVLSEYLQHRILFITYSLTKINRKSKSKVHKYQFWVVTCTVVVFVLLGPKRFIS